MAARQAPSNFTDDAFETYLMALATEGHAYYLSVTELLAVSEGVRANVGVVRRSEGVYTAIGRYLGGVGDVAVVVLEGGEQRGHFSRLCDGRLMAGADSNTCLNVRPCGRAEQLLQISINSK